MNVEQVVAEVKKALAEQVRARFVEAFEKVEISAPSALRKVSAPPPAEAERQGLQEAADVGRRVGMALVEAAATAVTLGRRALATSRRLGSLGRRTAAPDGWGRSHSLGLEAAGLVSRAE